MANWYEDEKFLKLRKQWYDKLEKKGFKDIEHIDWADGSSGNLLDGFGHMDAVRLYTPQAAEYYSLAQRFNWVLAEPVPAGQRSPYTQLACIKNKRGKARKRLNISRVRKIWAMHAEGKSISDIASALHESRPTVSAIIKELARMMFDVLSQQSEGEELPCSLAPESV